MMAYGMIKYFQLLRRLKIRKCFITVCIVLVKLGKRYFFLDLNLLFVLVPQWHVQEQDSL